MSPHQSNAMQKCKNAKMHNAQCKNAKIQKCKNAKMQKFKNAKMQKCKNAQCTMHNAKMQKCKNAQSHNAKLHNAKTRCGPEQRQCSSGAGLRLMRDWRMESTTKAPPFDMGRSPAQSCAVPSI
jgi:hypothetical protein